MFVCSPAPFRAVRGTSLLRPSLCERPGDALRPQTRIRVAHRVTWRACGAKGSRPRSEPPTRAVHKECRFRLPTGGARSDVHPGSLVERGAFYRSPDFCVECMSRSEPAFGLPRLAWDRASGRATRSVPRSSSAGPATSGSRESGLSKSDNGPGAVSLRKDFRPGPCPTSRD